ncbi:MAG: methionyl-tRNA formyltransferase [bacterium]
MKVVILGSGQMLMNLIAGCMDAGCEIVGVFRYDKVRYPLVDRFFVDLFNPSLEYTYIKSHNLYEINARSANSAEFKKEILKLNADVVLVGTWGEKLKKNIINLPKLATINVHPSLLPKYRGPNPYLQAIKHLETKSGVTFHLMDENFDTGAILLQKVVPIEPTDTGKELREKIVLASRGGVCELLKTLNAEIIIPIAQDEKHASYFTQISEDDVMLDFSKSAQEVSAHIRAFHPWFKCYFPHGKNFFTPNPYKLEITENNSNVTDIGTIIEKDHKCKSITVLCGDNRFLKMEEVKLYGYLSRFFTAFYIKHMVKKS